MGHVHEEEQMKYMFKELLYLIKLVFNSKFEDKLELVPMNYFPFKGYKYLMWCGKIIYRKDMEDKRKKEWETSAFKKDFNHETIHLNQAKRSGSWFKYYWQYFIEWLKGNPIIAPASSAYHTNPFEIEAYANENNIGYIPTEESFKRYFISDRKDKFRTFRTEWKKYCRSLNIKES